MTTRPTAAMIFTRLAAALTCLAAVPAAAQDAGSDWAFVVGAGTDNRSKDASKSDGAPYVFGAAEWTSADDYFYGGSGLETIDAGGSDVEVEAVFGYRPEWVGFDWDFKAAYKYRAGADDGYDEDGVELTATVRRSIGPARARVQVQHAPDATGSTDSFTWFEGQVGWDFTDTVSGTAAVGRREQDGGIDYTGWNAGLTLAATDDIDLDLRWYDTDVDEPGEQYEGELVAKVSVAF